MRQFYLYLLFFITINHLYPQSTILALPENTIKKTLHTGFTYVVMPNNTPKNKVEIRLCLRVGSAQENKNNEGVAHFIEHLAFNGSKNYPNNQAIAFWESLGAKFGETINAYTTDDRTVYSISLSNINEEQLQKTIDILADWLYNMSITPKNIEKERRIITEEIASYQPRKDLNPIKVGYDPHLSHLPIGTKEQVQKITQKDLLDFYQQYYTPQYATLIVVGDVATSSTVKSIENTFKTLLNKNELPAISTINSVHFTEKPYFLDTEKGKKGKDTLTLLYPKKYNSTHWRGIVEDYIQKVVINLLKNRMKAANKEVPISQSC